MRPSFQYAAVTSGPSLRKAYQGALKFIASRRVKGGGYSFAKSTPVTLADTYFALRTCVLLDQSVTRDREIIALLSEFYEGEALSWENYYRLTYLFRYVANKPSLPISAPKVPPWVDDTYWLV